MGKNKRRFSILNINAVTIKVFQKFSSLVFLINSVIMKKRKPLAVCDKNITNTCNNGFDDIKRNLSKYTKKSHLGKFILRNHYKPSENYI